VKQNLITYEEALKHVSNPDDFALRFRGIASTSDGTWDDFEGQEETAEEKIDNEFSDSDFTDDQSPDEELIDRF
jgi:hypothetical protein